MPNIVERLFEDPEKQRPESPEAPIFRDHPQQNAPQSHKPLADTPTYRYEQERSEPERGGGVIIALVFAVGFTAIVGLAEDDWELAIGAGVGLYVVFLLSIIAWKA